MTVTSGAAELLDYDDVIARFESELANDLKSGRWDQRYGRYRTQPFLEGSLKIIVGRT